MSKILIDMIQKLVNGALTDGQLEECPLTIQEITTVIRVFSTSLLGIYHHRIAYPSMPEEPGTVTIPVITLEVTNPTRDLTPAPDDSPSIDPEQKQRRAVKRVMRRE